MNPVLELKNDLAGLAVLQDWLGSGMVPVPAKQSESRAAICTSCPMNEKGGWWNFAKDALASEIRKQIGLKQQLNVSTTLDDFLGTCKVCSCNLPLKVHVPTAHVKEHTTPEQLAAFPYHCWVKAELEVPN